MLTASIFLNIAQKRQTREVKTLTIIVMYEFLARCMVTTLEAVEISLQWSYNADTYSSLIRYNGKLNRNPLKEDRLLKP